MRQPSPYVSLYMARGAAEAALKALRKQAVGKTPSNPLWSAIKELERGLGG